MTSISPNAFPPITRSQSDTSRITRSSSTCIQGRTTSTALGNLPLPPSGGKIHGLRPKRPRTPVSSQESSQKELQINSQKGSQENSQQSVKSPYNFLRQRSNATLPTFDGHLAKKRKEEEEEEKSTQAPSTQEPSSSLTSSSSSSSTVNTQTLVDEINTGAPMIELIHAENIYQFLLEVGEKITHLNLTQLDRKVKMGSAKLTQIIVKIASLRNLTNLRVMEFTVLRGNPGELAGMALSNFFKFTPRLKKFVCSDNENLTSEFITPMIHGIGQLTRLRHLVVEKLTDQDLTILTSQFSKISDLSLLKILDSPLTDVKTLSDSFETLTILTDFTLGIKDEYQVKHIAELCIKAFSQPNMENFELRIRK